MIGRNYTICRNASSQSMTTRLSTSNHDRNTAGLKYIYPVISRRAGGLSVGINVNTNNACNWRCIYCQVPGLSIGTAPEIDFDLLVSELRWFLQQLNSGEFYRAYNVPVEQQSIKDIAISGNGEPTSVKGFSKLVRLIENILHEHKLLPTINKVLITNGSLIHKQDVQQGLMQWHAIGGEIWFKLDSATASGRSLINNTPQSDRQVIHNLRLAASLCTTKIQTCLLYYKGQGWSAQERQSYLELLSQMRNLSNLRHVMLYTLARPSQQPEAMLLESMSVEAMQQIAIELEAMGFIISISA